VSTQVAPHRGEAGGGTDVGSAAWLRAMVAHPAAPYLLLVVGWLALLPLTMHYGNPDGPSYVLVAERWASGQLPEAVNAYWGPLLSWGAAPLIAVGVPGLLALRLVLLAGALLTLGPLRTLCRRAGASPVATQTLLFAGAAFLVYNALFGLYADVLMSMALLRASELLSRDEVTRRPATAVRAGAWAGVAYLARAYAVPVALLLLPLAATLHLARRDVGPGAVARTAGLTLAGLALVGGTWAAVLSGVYGEPTFSTSAGFNAELVAPGSQGNPYNVPGLHEPTRPDAVSGWEEPSRLPIPGRDTAAPGRDDGDAAPDAVGSRPPSATPGERVELAVANARIMVGSVARRGAVVAVLALVALGWHLRRRRWPTAAVAVPLLAGMIAAAGLPLIIAIERYLWFPILAAVPAAAVGLDVAVGARPRLRRWASLGVVAVTVAASLHGLAPRLGAHVEVTAAARALDGHLAGRVATAESWQRSHLLCFRVDCVYLGRPLGTDVESVATELHGHDVHHLLVWEGDEDEIDGLGEAEAPGTLTVHEVVDGDEAGEGPRLVPRWRVHGEEVTPLDGADTRAQ
jgi:hypothetical protein